MRKYWDLTVKKVTYGGGGVRIPHDRSMLGMTSVLSCVLVLAMAVFAVSAVPFAHAQADSAPPTLAGASLDEGTGVLVLAFSENVDQTPISDIDPSGFTITDSDGDSPVPLTGAEVSSVNATAISITLDAGPDRQGTGADNPDT